MPDMRRVSTRDFLRNINSMTEPVEVYSRHTLKGIWYPNTTWPDLHDDTRTQLYSGRDHTPTSNPRSVRADALEAAPGVAPQPGAVRPTDS